MVTIASIWAAIGCLTILWFLTDCYRAKKRIDNGTGTPSDQRVMDLMQPFTLAVFLPFLLLLWPVAVYMFIKAGGDDEGDDNPQSNVPPQYR